MKRLLIFLILTNLLLVACGGSPTPDVEATVQAAITATQAAQPTDTPLPTDTPTPQPTDTPAPTDTPTPQPTDTPEPTDTPTPQPTDTPKPSACVPSLISPEEGAILDNGRTDKQDDQVWNFDWSDCPGATQYHLYVIDSNATIPVVDAMLNNSSYQDVCSECYILEQNRFDWMWKVRVKIAGQWGAWSEIRTFDVEPVNSDPSSSPAQSIPTPVPTDTPVPVPPTATPVAEPAILFRDDFDGALAAGWSWVREDPIYWNLSDAPGSLRIILQPGNIGAAAGSPANNLLLREAPAGSFEIATLVRFTPASNFQFAGLLIYQDDSNAIQFGRAYCNTPNVCIGNGIYFDNIQFGEFGENYATATANQSEAYLRLRREGATYTGYYSEDGTNWTIIGQHTGNLTSLRVGLIAAQAFEAETTADFDYFTIEALP